MWFKYSSTKKELKLKINNMDKEPIFIRGNKVVFLNGVIILIQDNSPHYLSKISSFIIKGEEPGFKIPEGKSFTNSINRKTKL